MSVCIHSAVTFGLNVIPVTIEAALGNGFSGLQILGLPQEYSRDARERIRAALEGLGLSLPARRLIISVRPSEILKNFKTGLEHLDLACAISVLAALSEQTQPPRIASINLKKIAHELARRKHFFAGQLLLSGEVLPLSTSLPFEILSLKDETSLQAMWCHPHNIQPESQIRSRLFECTHLLECLLQLTQKNFETSAAQGSSGTLLAQKSKPSASSTNAIRKEKITNTLLQFEHIPTLALALTLTALGRHHLLLAGSPGSGKTFALRALKNLLPPLSSKEKMDVALIHNRDPHEIFERPFRTPHHSASSAALLGGSLLQPGEVSLAHHGVLFLDELAEFPRPSLEALREPLDEKKISLARARGRIELPADFLLIAATNPCACGYVFSRHRQCRCLVGSPTKYQQKLSGPLLERFSMMLLVDDLSESFTISEDPFCSAQSFALREFARQWYREFQNTSSVWAEHFIQLQDAFWNAPQSSAPPPLDQSILRERAQAKKWSPRTVQRIASVVHTLKSLCTSALGFSLSNEQFITIAEELRAFEHTLQKSVHLLTPQPPLLNLKKLNVNHDISGGKV